MNKMNDCIGILDYNTFQRRYLAIELRNFQMKMCFGRNNLRCRYDYNAIYSNSKEQLKRVSIPYFSIKRKNIRYYDNCLICFCQTSKLFFQNII